MTTLILKQYMPSPNLILCGFAGIITLAVISANSIRNSEHKEIEQLLPEPTIVEASIKTDSLNAGAPSPEIITGKIHYSFITTLIKAGLEQHEITTLISRIENKFDIINQAKKGDKFSIMKDINSDNESYISAFYYQGREKHFFFISQDGDTVYNEYGDSLDNTQYKPPLTQQYRISSGFNMERFHPVTHRITPHLGTDFAVPTGTKVLSIADGIVIKSRYNRFAGHYVNVRHNNNVVSRYLHLSKRKVKVGDRITQGQAIGLSGNSGRTTGAHLHIEVWVNDSPVDYLTFMKQQNTQINTPILLAAQQHKSRLIAALEGSAQRLEQ